MDIHLDTSQKGKSNANTNQVSSKPVANVENFSVALNQCPISKAQCEQLLAFLNTGGNLGDGNHVATVSTVTTSTGVEGTSGVVSNVAFTSSQPQFNLMSGIQSNFTPNLEHSIFSAKTVNREAFSKSDQVINTGATDHMIHSISYYTSITATLNTHVHLPNGEIALVTHIGTVQISEKLVLHNVLCVLSFSFNLTSVSQIAKSTLCCLIFFGNLCFIQALAP